MPLPLSTNDGEFTPYIKYNAKAGRFYVRPQGATQDMEVVNPRLAFDMANIKTGWIFFQEGVGPEKVWDIGGKQAPRPPGPQKWKRGFEVIVFGPDRVAPGGAVIGLREFASTASNVIAAILKMYDEYEKGAAANQGKVPVFACQRVIPIQGAYGTNYEPEFKLTTWIERAKVPQFDEHLAGQDAAPPSNFGLASHQGNGKADQRPMVPVTGTGIVADEIPF